MSGELARWRGCAVAKGQVLCLCTSAPRPSESTSRCSAWHSPNRGLHVWIFDSGSVYLETPTAELKVTRLQEVQQYERLFSLLQAQAVYGRDARRLITKAMDGL
ncbi:Scr1 family TA system antitoxin-like transcriptional regulator [Pilimelia columellifera]|uniref:Scr1 family TA system antitoxin-like transcriptional regulator n=1 Tax=Pilimelia columellifera TaxID=706574 RepID=UPI003CD05C3E